MSKPVNHPLRRAARAICGLVAWCMAAATAAGDELPDRIGDAWSDARNPIVRIFEGRRLDLWSLRPLKATDPQPVATADALHPIDQFVLQRLPEAARRLAPDADRRTLARRLYFDLTGLPPSPNRLEQFLADGRPDAYERLVDELLASPEYGEQMARMWLDVVRYSDSNGFDWDEFRPNAWRFRDYVIASFRADKPIDQLIREHLAGDELVAGAPQTRAEQEALVGTTYLRLGPQDNSASLFDEQPRARAEWMADLVETTASAFLALTFSCCRCHDHKYDPLSQEDHFRLRAFFEPLEYANDIPVNLAKEQQEIKAHNARLDQEIERVKKQREQLRAQVRKRLSESVKRSAEPSADEAAAEPSEEAIIAAFTDQQKQRDEQLEQKIEALEGHRRKLDYGLLVKEKVE